MRRVLLTLALIAAMALTANAEVIAEIHTDNGMDAAIEIQEGPPIVMNRDDDTQTSPDAPEATETAPAVYKDISVSEEEFALLRSILALEADYATEGFDGQKAVVEVVFNRVLSDKWPNTVADVIYQKGQFATVKYLKKPYNLPGEHEDDAISAVLRETETVLPDMRYVYFSRGKSNGRDFVKLNHHWFSR